jgi:AcrR family transcriptional regulator
MNVVPARRTRRRGTALEDLILGATWQLLRTDGYSALTIDGIARTIGTSRAVIYRRWPNKPSLAYAAVRAHTGSIADDVPDTGSLPNDVRATLRALSNRIERVGIDVMIALLDLVHEFPEDAVAVVPQVIEQLVNRARSRGEIGDSPIPDVVLRMPTALLRYAMITDRATPSQETIDSITDQLFIPLVMEYGARPLRVERAKFRLTSVEIRRSNAKASGQNAHPRQGDASAPHGKDDGQQKTSSLRRRRTDAENTLYPTLLH